MSWIYRPPVAPPRYSPGLAPFADPPPFPPVDDPPIGRRTRPVGGEVESRQPRFLPRFAPFLSSPSEAVSGGGYLADGPLAWPNPGDQCWPRNGASWRFLGVAGTSVPDNSGSANTGALNGSAAWSRDAYGPAISFPGSTAADNVTVASPTSADAAGKQITVAATVTSASASQNGGVLDKTIGGNTNTQFLMFLEGGVPKFRVCDNPSGSSTSVGAGEQYTAVADAAIETTRPHRLVGVYDGAAVKLYVDGVLQSTAPAATFAVVAGAGSVLIGALGSSLYPFNGRIGDVFVDASAWTLTQVQADLADPGRPYRFRSARIEALFSIQADVEATTASRSAGGRRSPLGAGPEASPPRGPASRAVLFGSAPPPVPEWFEAFTRRRPLVEIEAFRFRPTGKFGIVAFLPPLADPGGWSESFVRRSSPLDDRNQGFLLPPPQRFQAFVVPPPPLGPGEWDDSLARRVFSSDGRNRGLDFEGGRAARPWLFAISTAYDLVAALAEGLRLAATAAGADCYLDEAGRQAAFPYLVVSQISEEAEHSTADDVGESQLLTTRVQISAVASGSAGAADARKLIDAVEDRLPALPLDFSRGRLVGARKVLAYGPRQVSRTTPTGAAIWQSDLILEVFTERYI